MPRTFTRGQAAAISTCPPDTITEYIRNGELIPTEPGGPGVQHRFGEVLVFGLALYMWLRTKDWAIHEATSVRRAVLAIPRDRLLACFAEGKTHLLIVNGSCLPLLWHESLTTADNPVIAEAAQSAAAEGIALNLRGLDLATAWADFQSQLNRKARPRREGIA